MAGHFQGQAKAVEEGELLNALFQMMDECRILNHTRVDDDFGGYKETWTEGASFQAAIAKNTSTEQIVAEKQGVSESFTVVVHQDFTLDYHDVFKRVSDNAIFRVTSRTVDSTAHPRSTVKIAKVTAERWVLP